MFGECHAHMILDGVYFRDAIDRHKCGVAEELVRACLRQYAEHGVTFVRDGGDAWGVADYAKKIAGEYGIDYRSPSSPIYRKGYYGSFIGMGYGTMREYHALVLKMRQNNADFIKIMISGLMDFDCFEKLSCESRPAEEIAEMIHIAHEEGFAVMAHANGARTVEAAVKAGVDSIEHGAYLDEDALSALAESETPWIPTLSTVGNLLEDGRYSQKVLRQIYDLQRSNLARFCEMGGNIGLGSDAGAYLVPHVRGIETEYGHLRDLVSDERFIATERMIRERFCRKGLE